MPSELADRWLKDDVAGAARLAELLSLASLIDPGLLRAARLKLNLSVSAELELRCSPILSSATPGGLVIADEVLPALRQNLGRDPDRLKLAWDLTRARHPHLSPALVMEETLTWVAMESPSSVAGT